MDHPDNLFNRLTNSVFQISIHILNPKYFLLCFILAFSIKSISQSNKEFSFNNIPVVMNLDSMENEANKKNFTSRLILKKLLILERSRFEFQNYKRGSDLHIVDSLCKITNCEEAKLILRYFTISLNLRNNVTLEETNNELKFLKKQFQVNEDTVGILKCLKSLIDLRLIHEQEMASDKTSINVLLKEMEQLVFYTRESENVLIYNLNVLKCYTTNHLINDKELKLKIFQNLYTQTEKLINSNSKFNYLKPVLLSTKAKLLDNNFDCTSAIEVYKMLLSPIYSNYSYVQVIALINISNSYSRINNIEMVELYAKKAIEYYTKYNLNETQLILVSYSNWANAKFSLKQYDSAWILRDSYDNIKNSSLTKNRFKEYFDLQLKYDASKKDAQNKLLEQQQNFYKIAIITSLLFLFLIAYLLIKSIRQNRLLIKLSSFQDKVHAIISHDLRSPILGLEGLSKQASFLIKHNRLDELENISKKIDESSFKINNLLSSLLVWAIADKIKSKNEIQTANLYSSIDKTIDLYKDKINLAGIEIKIAVSKEITLNTNVLIIDLINRNWIDNILKHTSTTKIEFSAFNKDTVVVYSIQNDVYLSEELVENIKTKIREGYTSSLNKTNNLGLSLIGYFAQKEGWGIDIKSDIETGTIFEIVMPIKSTV